MDATQYTTVSDGIESLTRFQLPVYNYIVDRFSKNGVPPTMREIGRGLNVSLSNVYHHMHMIIDKGLIVRSGYKRNYRVVGMEMKLNKDAPLYKIKEQ